MTENDPRASPSSRGAVLDLIRASGPVSRVEIAGIVGMTQGSVSMIVRRLLEDGLVHEVGHGESTGGKRRTLLEINEHARFALGVQLGFESISFIATNMAGDVIGRQRYRGAGDEDPSDVVDRICRDLEEFLDNLEVDRSALVGVGVAAPGPIDHESGVVLGPPTLRHWQDFPLREELSRRIGLFVTVDKDATAAAVGEFWGGHMAAPSAFACVYMGTGIGSGIMIDGAVYRGSASNAGELGHISIDPAGVKCFCGNVGCLETICAPAAVVEKARHSTLAEQLSTADLATLHNYDRIARLAVQGQSDALGLIQETAGHLAGAVVSLLNLLDLDLVVLAGPGFAIAGSIYATVIRRAVAERFFARSSHNVEIRISVNPRDAAAVGASALVLQRSLAPRSPVAGGAASPSGAPLLARR